jgi:hypothetical protein
MIYFTETQKFRQWWFIIMLVAFNLFFVYGFIAQFFFGIPFGDRPLSTLGLCIVLLLPLFISLLLLRASLTTAITDEGVEYQFSPFHFKKRIVRWNTISECYVRQCQPLLEYGGWGIRYTFKNGKAYNIRGNKGLQLLVNQRNKILIGTQKEEELKEALEKVKIKQF